MTDVDSKENIATMLAPLIGEARRRKLWLYCSYQGLWFSPDELAKENANGKFLWGPVNWQLRDPAEGLARLAQKVDDARAEMNRFIARLPNAF
jgi:hypothetical protein